MCSGPHGGKRYSKFAPETQALIELFVWGKLKEDPTRRVADYVHALSEVGVEVTRWWIDRLFKRWGLSWKKPMYKQASQLSPQLQCYSSLCSLTD